MKTLIAIPARMASVRFPNKPMIMIDGKPMIQRVWEKAIESNLGKVIVACCEDEVFNLITSIGGQAILTNPDLPSGTDRVYEAIKNLDGISQYDSIINLQGDMPLIRSNDISKVNISLKQGFDIGTLITDLTNIEKKDPNITKAKINWIKKYLIGKAIDFDRSINNTINAYHHVGIYSFRFDSLKKFVYLSPSKNEKKLKLEQMRAIDANMTIGVSYIKEVPLSVDTKEDLFYVEKLIKNYNEQN